MRSHPDWRKGPRGDLSDPLAPLFLWLVGPLLIELCVVVDTEQRMAGSGMAEVSSRWLFLCGPSTAVPGSEESKNPNARRASASSVAVNRVVRCGGYGTTTAGSGMAEVSSRWLFLCGPSVLLDQCLQFLRLQFGALGMQFGLTAQGYAVDGR